MTEGDVEPDPTFSERNVHTVEPARMPPKGRAWLSPSDPGAPTGIRLMVTASGYRAYYLIYRPRNGDKSRAYRIGTAEDLSYREASPDVAVFVADLDGDVIDYAYAAVEAYHCLADDCQTLDL